MKLIKLLVKLNGGKEDGASKNFADKMGVTPQRVSHWVTGRYVPEEDLRPKMAKLLGVTPEQLTACFPSREERNAAAHGTGERGAAYHAPELTPAQTNAPQMVPFFGPVCAGGSNFSFDAIPESYLPLYMPVPKGRRIGSWLVKGDCMDDGSVDSIRPGDTVVVIEQDYCESGKTVVAMINGEITLKKILHCDGHVKLQPKNPKHAPIIVKMEDIKILGVVIYSYRRH